MATTAPVDPADILVLRLNRPSIGNYNTTSYSPPRNSGPNVCGCCDESCN